MLWKPDPEISEARNLPDWGKFHRVCGRAGFFFFEKIARERTGAITAATFTIIKQSGGDWRSFRLSEGRGRTVLDALADAFGRIGFDVPEAEALLARRLAGEDEFATRLGAPARSEPGRRDEFTELLR